MSNWNEQRPPFRDEDDYEPVGDFEWVVWALIVALACGLIAFLLIAFA